MSSDFDFGSKGTLSLWVQFLDLDLKNTLVVGPIGEGLAQKNSREAMDKSFDFQVKEGGQPSFIPTTVMILTVVTP